MEPPMALPIEEIITSLGNQDKSLLNSKLAQLSSLGSAELKLLDQVWETIETNLPDFKEKITKLLV